MTGVAQIDDVAAALLDERGKVSVRLALAKTEGDWEPRTFEVTAGEPPPRWRELDWQYPSAWLTASVMNVATVARWLQERRIKFEGITVPLDDLAANAITERRQSAQQYGGNEPLDWPADEWRIAMTNQTNAFVGDLISDRRAPSFRSFDVAVASMLGLTSRPGWNVSTRELVVRRQDTSGRISRVFVDVATVDVTVAGEALAGAAVELASDDPGETHSLDGGDKQTVQFPTPDGLPPGAWVLLHRSGAWVDRRTLWGDQRLIGEAGVEYAMPPSDPSDNSFFSDAEQTEVKAAIAAVKVLIRVEMPELTASQFHELNGRLDDIASSVSTLGRRQWRDHVRGVFLGLFLEQVVPRDIVEQVAHMLVRDLSHLLSFLLSLPLPALPP